MKTTLTTLCVFALALGFQALANDARADDVRCVRFGGGTGTCARYDRQDRLIESGPCGAYVCREESRSSLIYTFSETEPDEGSGMSLCEDDGDGEYTLDGRPAVPEERPGWARCFRERGGDREMMCASEFRE